MAERGQVLKRLLLGRPIATEEERHQLLSKLLALPVFTSDALSSVAYATEVLLVVLLVAGRGALGYSMQISIAVAVLMVIVIASYRQTVRAYPRGGSGYMVARENLGTPFGLVAAASLLVVYVITVSVSMAAGAFAMASFWPALLEHRVVIALAFVVLITVANLRGLRESGVLFAVPTYAFVVSMIAMILVGIARCVGGTCPPAETADLEITPEGTLTVMLVLTAFAKGTTALTGIEATVDGVTAFRGRTPQEQAGNAAKVLAIFGVLSISMYLGLTYLSTQMNVVPTDERSVPAQIARGLFGEGALFGIVQITTTLILILAANTAFQDFPRLSSVLARDRFMPRQFINRGDRLVFSNGVVALAVLASVLLVAFDADLHRLVPLYLVGVVTAFTLSQGGMVVRWRRMRPPGWRSKAIMNAVGAITTGIVLLIVIRTTFLLGAWMTILGIALTVWAFMKINRHYRTVAAQLRRPEQRTPRIIGTRAVVLVPRIDSAVLRAVGYARALRPREVRAVHFSQNGHARGLLEEWEARRIATRLDVVPCDDGDLLSAVRRYVRSLEREPDEQVTVVIPERLRPAGWRQFLRRRGGLLLKAGLLFEPNVVVTDVPTIAEPGATEDAPARGAIAPTRVVAVVLVSAVHNATLRALAYASALSPTERRAIMFRVDADETKRVIADWEQADVDLPLEVIDSPFREVRQPLIRYVRRVRSQVPDAVISVIIPEFVVRKRWHQFLHNQTALFVKAALLFEPGVVVTSVPFHLE